MTTTKSNAMLRSFERDPTAIMRLVLAFVVTAIALLQCQQAIAQSDVGSGKRRGVLIEFKEDINPLSGALLKRKFEAAVESDADVIILDIQSPGGFTSVTFELMDMVLEAKDVETVAYIEKDAISGAALLALSTDTILMRPDARMGDAGEIVMGEDGAFRYTPAKSRSVLAQKVRDTAEATGRPLALAEKMTDKDMVVYQATNNETGEKRYFSDKDLASREDADQWELSPSIREAGKEMFFTVNGRRGVELGMVDQTIEGRDELAKVLNLQEPIVEMERSWTDTLVFLLNSQFVTFLLLLIGLV
ncbi:MAG: peptidase, partial [Rhodopirellula sp.]|nr:peptidase [Rhodopirellula sp.]